MTASSRIVLCPGQGAQAVGMGKAWYDASPQAKAIFDAADKILAGRLPGGATLSSLCFCGPVDVLNRTDVSQPAIYTASVAAWRGLLAKWGVSNPADLDAAGLMAALGLSLGEYTALHIAGAFSFEAGLELVTLRGKAMQDAAEAVPGGMVALIGADEAAAESVCEKARQGSEILVVANLNAPGQVVVSGSKSACDRICTPEGLAAAGGGGLRATPLPVAGAFHSPLMAPAAERLKAALAKTAITPPAATVVSNVTARPHVAYGGASKPEQIAEQIRGRLVEQLGSPVRWAESCLWIASGVWGSGTYAAGQAGGGAEYHELAPGKTLAGLMRRIEKGIKVFPHDLPND